MGIIARTADKLGVLGSLVSGMGCALCFPALASLGSTIGLGVLAPWERLFVTTLLPLFAAIALAANIVNWFGHRRWYRGAVSVLGPLLVLASLFPLWRFAWSAYTFYVGLALMLAVAVWDLASPPRRRQCAVDTRVHSAPPDVEPQRGAE